MAAWDLFYVQGAKLLMEKEYEKSIEFFNEALPLTENHKLLAETYYSRSVAYYSLDEDDKAIADLKKASDYGNEKTLEILKENFNINYTPQKPSSSSAPNSGGSSSSVSNSKEYVGTSYDIVDNIDGGFFKRKHPSDGYLVFIINRQKGNPNINDIKFVFDGKEAMLNRNSSQTVYFPYLNGDICSLLRSLKSVYFMEMEGKNICYEYIAFNQIISTPLPIPQNEKDRFKKK